MQNKEIIVQALRGTVPGHQCGRRKSPERANRVQKALQIQNVRGDWRKAANLLPIWPLHHLFLGGVQRDNRVDGGACVLGCFKCDTLSKKIAMPVQFPPGHI